MTWDTRRLAMGIELAALYLCATALLITGHWMVAVIATFYAVFADYCFWFNWKKAGEPQLKERK